MTRLQFTSPPWRPRDYTWAHAYFHWHHEVDGMVQDVGPDHRPGELLSEFAIHCDHENA